MFGRGVVPRGRARRGGVGVWGRIPGVFALSPWLKPWPISGEGR